MSGRFVETIVESFDRPKTSATSSSSSSSSISSIPNLKRDADRVAERSRRDDRKRYGDREIGAGVEKRIGDEEEVGLKRS